MAASPSSAPSDKRHWHKSRGAACPKDTLASGAFKAFRACGVSAGGPTARGARGTCATSAAYNAVIGKRARAIPHSRFLRSKCRGFLAPQRLWARDLNQAAAAAHQTSKMRLGCWPAAAPRDSADKLRIEPALDSSDPRTRIRPITKRKLRPRLRWTQIKIVASWM